MEKEIKYDYYAQSTGDMTDYLSERFDDDLKWDSGHLNGEPLLHMMKALEPIILFEQRDGIIYVGASALDEFVVSREMPYMDFVYEIYIDEDDKCCSYITKIKDVIL